MSFPVTTGTFGTIATATETLSWDTDSPRADGPGAAGERLVVDGMTASWATEVLPPVSQPSTVTFMVYMSGPDPLGTWMPWVQGEPITVAAYAYRAGSPVELFTFKGRVQDASAVNHPAGGILFRFICVDRLADLASMNSPAELVLPNEPPLVDLFDAYTQLADDADIDFDWLAGQGWVEPYWLDMVSPIDMTNTTTLDALSIAVAHDIRVDAAVTHTVMRWLTQQVDTGSTDPEPVARYRLNEWDPQAVDDLAGVFAFHWTGTVWTIVQNTDYYTDGGTGMVLSADQLARDVGEWRQTRDQAINTVEGTSPLTFNDGTKTTRQTFAAAGELRNTRSVPCWYLQKIHARSYLFELLLTSDQAQLAGYGFTQLQVAWEQLTDDQLDTWAGQLWPRFGVAPLGRAFAVVGIPDHWRLSGPVVVGRMMSCTITLDSGVVRVALGTRAVPPFAVDGVTLDDIAGFSPVQMTLNNVDPSITIDSLAIVGPTPL